MAKVNARQVVCNRYVIVLLRYVCIHAEPIYRTPSMLITQHNTYDQYNHLSLFISLLPLDPVFQFAASSEETESIRALLGKLIRLST
jgi:hypothetical protein